jgi:hypothetical protein
VGWVVSVTPLPRFTTGTHWTGFWVGLRAGLDKEVRGKNPSPMSNSGRPVCSQTLHWLSYPSSNRISAGLIALKVYIIRVITGRGAWQKCWNFVVHPLVRMKDLFIYFTTSHQLQSLCTAEWEIASLLWTVVVVIKMLSRNLETRKTTKTSRPEDGGSIFHRHVGIITVSHGVTTSTGVSRISKPRLEVVIRIAVKFSCRMDHGLANKIVPLLRAIWFEVPWRFWNTRCLQTNSVSTFSSSISQSACGRGSIPWASTSEGKWQCRVLWLLGFGWRGREGEVGCTGFTTSVLTLPIKRKQKKSPSPHLISPFTNISPNVSFVNLFHEMLDGRIPYILNWLPSNVYTTPFAIGVWRLCVLELLLLARWRTCAGDCALRYKYDLKIIPVGVVSDMSVIIDDFIVILMITYIITYYG